MTAFGRQAGSSSRRASAARLTVALCLWIAGASSALGADAIDQQRAALQAERERVERQYAAEVAECRTRFVVTACTEAASTKRRASLQQADRQQIQLNEALRRQRAADSLDRVDQKVQRRRQQTPKPLDAAPDAAVTQPAAPGDASPAGSLGSGSAAPREVPSDAVPAEALAAQRATARARAEQAARNASDLRKREAEVRTRRAAVERRNAEREASGRASAAPLPPPSSLPPASGPR